MRMPPLPADSIHARACKLKCEKILTRPTDQRPQQEGDKNKRLRPVLAGSYNRDFMLVWARVNSN